VIKAAEYLLTHEPPNEDFPLFLITGRTLSHFHTRTKTGRTPQLQAAAPEVWVEMSIKDADNLGIDEGDEVEISSPRGVISAQVRVSGIRDGILFVPFHYGYWDVAGGKDADHRRAANELTITDWDPVSKQPIFKTAATRVSRMRAGNGNPAPAPTNTGYRGRHGHPAANRAPGQRNSLQDRERSNRRSPSQDRRTLCLLTQVPAKRGQHQGVRATGEAQILVS
jgi:predicted molibdopterin-dependent oxidoreductase YjgC